MRICSRIALRLPANVRFEPEHGASVDASERFAFGREGSQGATRDRRRRVIRRGRRTQIMSEGECGHRATRRGRERACERTLWAARARVGLGGRRRGSLSSAIQLQNYWPRSRGRATWQTIGCLARAVCILDTLIHNTLSCYSCYLVVIFCGSGTKC